MVDGRTPVARIQALAARALELVARARAAVAPLVPVPVVAVRALVGLVGRAVRVLVPGVLGLGPVVRVPARVVAVLRVARRLVVAQAVAVVDRAGRVGLPVGALVVPVGVPVDRRTGIGMRVRTRTGGGLPGLEGMTSLSGMRSVGRCPIAVGGTIAPVDTGVTTAQVGVGLVRAVA